MANYTDKIYFYWHDFRTDKFSDPNTYEDKNNQVNGELELEFDTTWHPCFYAWNDLDPSADKPTGVSTEGTLVVCLGSGCLNEVNTVNRLTVEGEESLYQNNVLAWENSDTGFTNSRILETDTGFGIQMKYLVPSILYFGPESSSLGTISISEFLHKPQNVTYEWVSNYPVFFNYDAAQLYASTGQGTPDVPAKEDESDKDESPDDWNDDSADHDDLDDNAPIDSPASSPVKVKGAINTYVMDANGVEAIIKWFWNGMIDEIRREEFLSYLSGIFGDMSQTLIGIQMYPFPVPHLTNAEVILGRYKSQLYRTELNSDSNLICSFTTKINRKLGNFMDFSPYTRLMIYLPFIGIRELETNNYMGRTITVKYYADYSTGGLDVYLMNGNTVVEHYTGRAAADVPYSFDGGKDLRNKFIDSAINGGIAAIGAGVGMAVGGATGSAGAGAMAGSPVQAMLDSFTGDGMQNQGNTMHYSGMPSNGNIMNAPRHIQIWRISPQYYVPKLPNGRVDERKNQAYKKMYGRTNGYVLMRNKELGKLSGFTICQNVKLSFGNTKTTNESGTTITVVPTDAEFNEIKQLLEGGVYL